MSLGRKLRTWIANSWGGLKRNKDQLTLTFGAFAGIFVAIEYFNNNFDAKVRRTLEFQARFGQSDLLGPRLKLDSFWFRLDSATLAAAEGATKPEKITTIVVRNNMDPHVLLLADFIGQVTTCLERDLCELETTCAVFQSHVNGLAGTYSDLFKKWKAEWGEHLMAHPHEYFTKHCPKDPTGRFKKLWWLRGILR